MRLLYGKRFGFEVLEKIDSGIEQVTKINRLTRKGRKRGVRVIGSWQKKHKSASKSCPKKRKKIGVEVVPFRGDVSYLWPSAKQCTTSILRCHGNKSDAQIVWWAAKGRGAASQCTFLDFRPKRNHFLSPLFFVFSSWSKELHFRCAHRYVVDILTRWNIPTSIPTSDSDWVKSNSE